MRETRNHAGPTYVPAKQSYCQPDGPADESQAAHRYKLPEEIWAAERADIDERRKNLQANAGTNIEENLVGLALSGGGIRSATFSLGVMQAFAKQDLLKYVDILSTVSGGGYIGSALTWLTSGNAGDTNYSTSEDKFPFGTDDPTESLPDPATLTNAQKITRYLRWHGEYLTPGKGITIMSGLAVVLRGAFLNLLVWLPLMTLLWYWVGSDFPKQAAIWAAVGTAALFVLGSILYSVLSAAPQFFPFRRYWLRRLFEVSAGIVLGVFFASLLILLPDFLNIVTASVTAEAASGQFGVMIKLLGMGGPGYMMLGLFGAFYAFIKMEKGVAANSVLAVSVFLVVVGVYLATREVAVWIHATPVHETFILPKWLGGLETTRVCLLWSIAAFVLFAGVFVNVNYISLHRYYRDRLMETFMPDEEVALANGTGPAKKANSARLGTFSNKYGPYHIINTNTVLVNATNKIRRIRRGDNFILSPRYCGGNAVGWRRTESFMGNRLTLATSMAVSGAAANPNAGVTGKGLTTNPLVSLLMSLLGIRLGIWVPNPKYRFVQWIRPNHFWPGLYEVGKLIGLKGYNENRAFLQISDGGHFENLAIYELIRRRAPLIICCDGGADQNFQFNDLHAALRLIETDFGVAINFDPSDLATMIPSKKFGYPADVKYTEKPYAVVDIDYPKLDNERNAAKSTLVFLKTAMVKNLSLRTLDYKADNPAFPDETTADQFFSPAQFDAYRDLGYQIGKLAIDGANLRDRLTAPSNGGGSS